MAGGPGARRPAPPRPRDRLTDPSEAPVESLSVPVRRIGVVNTRAAKEVILARETTEITAKIQAYNAGEMSRAELVQYLAHEHQYARRRTTRAR